MNVSCQSCLSQFRGMHYCSASTTVRVDVSAEHMEDFLYKIHNTVPAHIELCDIICDKQQSHESIKVSFKKVSILVEAKRKNKLLILIYFSTNKKIKRGGGGTEYNFTHCYVS